MKVPWFSSQNQSEEEQTTLTTQTMTESNNADPVLSFEGKKYDLQSLPDDLKELLRRLQVAEQQLEECQLTIPADQDLCIMATWFITY